MKQLMAGLHAGDRVRAERVTDGGWQTEVKLRDCGSLLGVTTGYLEGSDDGMWTNIGTFRKLPLAQKACDALFSGTHVYRMPYSSESGRMPGALVPSQEANDAIVAATALKP